ncbi:farnesyl-diphosphate synthase [Clostridia bacterium]|nr:farnesyl-diphosphate synthase [Clostridia bacterium]
MTFEKQYNSYKEQVEQAMLRALRVPHPSPGLTEATSYSLLAAGKRARPIILLAFCDACGGYAQDALPLAAGMEMIHNYSLIHDDLPCMDNADTRRGKPANHKAFGDGMALLAGDALLNLAFETMLTASDAPPDRLLRAMKVIARESGELGMIGGQALEFESNLKEREEKLSRSISSADAGEMLAQMRIINQLKTGALFRAAAEAGCIMADASPPYVTAAEQYAALLGEAFQLSDDILDINDGEPSAARLLGADVCRARVLALAGEAKNALEVFEDNAGFLKDLVDFLCDRKA